MVNIIIQGCYGKMGRMVAQLCATRDDMRVVAGIDPFAGEDLGFPVFETPEQCNVPCHVVVDFSRPEGLLPLIDFAKSQKCGVVLATTGLSTELQQAVADSAKQIPILQAANLSLGVALVQELVRRSASFLHGYDIEIVETHHNQKVDAPSGTALVLAEAAKQGSSEILEDCYGRSGKDAKRDPKEIGIHAVRGGTVVGIHEVGFYGHDEVITISHNAQSRALFAGGALRACLFVASKQNGFYSMQDMIPKS